MIKFVSTLLLLTMLLQDETVAQTIQTSFGKNRVQFHKDFDTWSQYESENFITYWYGEGRFVGQSVVLIAESEFSEVQSILEHRMNDKIEVIVFVDMTDLKQSNIGSEEAFENVTGQTKIVGNKMFVYFDGNHLNLRKQIREGIASVLMNAMLFGSNLQEIVQNAVMLNLPDWFKDGLISYCGEEWNTELDDQMRDIFLNNRYKSFEKFAEANPKLAGHSVWYYISQNYGRSTLSNLLYLTRINRSTESGFLYVLGQPFRRITEGWAIYFRQRYENEVKIFDPYEGNNIPVKNKHLLPLYQLKISPDGQKIAYVANDIGRYKVYVQDLGSGKRELIFKGGHRNKIQSTDYNYPLLAWLPGGNSLALIHERKDIIRLTQIDLTTKKQTTEPLDPQYQRVFSADFLDLNTLVFSAAVRGYSDIFLYYIDTRQTQRITQDFWDDLDASVVWLRNKPGILFTSNRADTGLVTVGLDTILPSGNFDVFYYDLKEKGKELVRISHTPHVNERHPVGIDTTWMAWLSEESGIYNRCAGYLEDYIARYDKVLELKTGDKVVLHIDSMLSELDTTLIDTTYLIPIIKQRAVSHYQTNSNAHIRSLHAAFGREQMVESMSLKGQTQFYLNAFDPAKMITPKPTRHHIQLFQWRRQRELSKTVPEIPSTPDNQLKPVDEKPIDVLTLPEEKMDTGKIDLDNYFFQTPFDEEEMPQNKQPVKEELQPAQEETYVIARPEFNSKLLAKRTGQHLFRPSRITPYRLKFRTDFVTTTLDNELLFEGLNSFAGTPERFDLPPPGILFKANFKELMEDYQIEGGVRVPTTFNGAEYFLFLDDKKHRWDKRYAVYRRNLNYIEDQSAIVPYRSEANTFIALNQWRYPFDIYRSFRGTGTFRIDRLTLLSTDAATLRAPIIREQRFGLKAEYVFDNTIDVALNIKNGTRYKVSVEAVKRLMIDFGEGAKVDFAKGFMGVVGVDARHYERLLKHSVVAVRFAGATSFGSEKILYYLGGVENWLFTQFDNSIPIPSNDFAYQTIAANLRGFKMNIRNGNSFALINTEVRIPFFRYIFPRVRSNFFRNFQVVGFFDAGTAWQGFSPFDNDNPLNTIQVPIEGVPGRDPVVLRVNYFRDPIVAGYGAGVRMMLFGYLIRADYAWGLETGKVQSPQFYISFGTDF